MNPIQGMQPKEQPPVVRHSTTPPGSPGFASAFQTAQTEWLYAVHATNPHLSTEKTKRKRISPPPSRDERANETESLVSAILSTLSAIINEEEHNPDKTS